MKWTVYGDEATTQFNAHLHSGAPGKALDLLEGGTTPDCSALYCWGNRKAGPTFAPAVVGLNMGMMEKLQSGVKANTVAREYGPLLRLMQDLKVPLAQPPIGYEDETTALLVAEHQADLFLNLRKIKAFKSEHDLLRFLQDVGFTKDIAQECLEGLAENRLAEEMQTLVEHFEEMERNLAAEEVSEAIKPRRNLPPKDVRDRTMDLTNLIMAGAPEEAIDVLKEGPVDFSYATRNDGPEGSCDLPLVAFVYNGIERCEFEPELIKDGYQALFAYLAEHRQPLFQDPDTGKTDVARAVLVEQQVLLINQLVNAVYTNPSEVAQVLKHCGMTASLMDKLRERASNLDQSVQAAWLDIVRAGAAPAVSTNITARSRGPRRSL